MATVLVIDDDEMIREVVRRALERAGHEVLEAAEGSEGLSRLRGSAVDLMIVDVMMPKKGGIETLMELRNSRPGMKTIVITGKVDAGSASFKNLIHAFGVKRVFQKPFDLEELVAAVQTILGEE